MNSPLINESNAPNRPLPFASAGRLRSLEAHYLLEEEHSINEILSEHPALAQLLTEAVNPLHEAFGANRIFELRPQFSDEDKMLKAVVQLPLDFAGNPEQALQSFDSLWWLASSHRSGGALLFDYEMQDTV